MTVTLSADTGDRAKLARELLPRPGAFIGGAWRYALNGGELQHVDPSTGTRTATFPLADAQDVSDAVQAAENGLDLWRSVPASQRAQVLKNIAHVIRENADELALLTTLEVGTPLEAARSRMRDVPAGWFEYYAGWCDKLTGDTIPEVVSNQFSMTIFEPVGVVAKLVTWNSPIGGIQMAVAAALAAGCSVVVRPSEMAPFTIMRFAELCSDVGLPAGVLNVLPADSIGAEALVSHPGVAKVSFTGGPSAARAIQRAAADALTPLVLELGGKSANLIFPDADLTRAVQHACSITSLAGQGCSLPSRLLVHEAVFDEVADRVLSMVRSTPQGDPFDPATQIGPVISEASLHRILGMIDRAREGGASILTGGRRAGGSLSEGFFVEPTVVGGIDPASEMAQQEVFGPVLTLIRFKDEDEAVGIANGTEYGLAAYVHTRDLSRAFRLARRLRAGNINLNGAISPSGYQAPFGGIKSSGYGKEGGREGILEFVTPKTININV